VGTSNSQFTGTSGPNNIPGNPVFSGEVNAGVASPFARSSLFTVPCGAGNPAPPAASYLSTNSLVLPQATDGKTFFGVEFFIQILAGTIVDYTIDFQRVQFYLNQVVVAQFECFPSTLFIDPATNAIEPLVPSPGWNPGVPAFRFFDAVDSDYSHINDLGEDAPILYYPPQLLAGVAVDSEDNPGFYRAWPILFSYDRIDAIQSVYGAPPNGGSYIQGSMLNAFSA
jgi:hypothetical protein